MVIKRTYMISLMFIAFLFISQIETAFCRVLAISDTGLTSSIGIRQERFQANSVLVCRPMLVDTEILDFVAKNRINTLDDYAKWVSGNIVYTRDKGPDSWSSAKETLQRKCGDCEDFAFLHETILRVMGYEPKVLAAGVGSTNHAICAFKANGKYMLFDNGNLKMTPASSLIDFASFILKNYKCSYLAELNFSQKKQTLLFSNSSVIKSAVITRNLRRR